MLALCDRFHCLPEPGGLLAQDAGLLRLLRVAELGGLNDEGAA